MKKRFELSAQDIADMVRDVLKVPDANVKFLVDVAGGTLHDVAVVVDGEIASESTDKPTPRVAMVMEMPPT